MGRAKDVFRTVGMKMLFGLLAVTVPLIALLLYINLYAIHFVRDQVTVSNQNLLSLYMGQIDRSLADIDKYLLGAAAEDLSLLRLERSAAEDADAYNLAKASVFRVMSEEIGNYKETSYFVVYSSRNREAIFVPGDLQETNFAQRETIKREFEERVLFDDAALAGLEAGRWLRFEADGRRYLFHLIRTGTVYVGALVNAEKLMVPLTLIDLGEKGRAYLDLADEGADPVEEGTLTVREPSTLGDFRLNVSLPEEEVLGNLPFIQRIVAIITLGAVAVYFLTFLFIRRVVLLPIQRIVLAMKRVRNGQLDVRLEPRSSSSEFELMNETFNSMAGQIQGLKISVYEEQLNHQKAELKHLQLQINPHFFLNSLNIVYYLAQSKDFRLIQEMALCLIEYFRYMFRSNSEFVRLEDEIKHTNNYLRIQELRFPNNLSFAVDWPEELGECRVPPLVIQSFAENAVKYAVSMDRHTTIGVRVAALGGKLTIAVEDDGPGFAEDVLQAIQGDGRAPANAKGEQIGIRNIRRRLELLYKQDASIEFGNRADRGAVVEIELPYVAAGREESACTNY